MQRVIASDSYPENYWVIFMKNAVIFGFLMGLGLVGCSSSDDADLENKSAAKGRSSETMSSAEIKNADERIKYQEMTKRGEYQSTDHMALRQVYRQNGWGEPPAEDVNLAERYPEASKAFGEKYAAHMKAKGVDITKQPVKN